MILATVIQFLGQATLVCVLAIAANPAEDTSEPGEEAAREADVPESRLCTDGRHVPVVYRSSNPDICIRRCLGGTPRPDLSSCHKVALEELGCKAVVTI